MSATRKTPLSRQPLYTATDFGSHESRILLLQGGGALGVYHVGGYEGAAGAGGHSGPTAAD